MKTMQNWQQTLSEIVTCPHELLRLVELEALIPETPKTHAFTLRVPRPFIARMEKGNPHCPLLLQVLPSLLESFDAPGYSIDPLAEEQASAGKGLLHKYQSRVLITLTSSCAINCRYCFRRHFPYQENHPGKKDWPALFDYIKNDTRINEVILSGGDPLLVPDNYLAEFIHKLADITHVTTLRIHTRLPVVIPARLTSRLLNVLTQTRLHSVLVTHINHANEIDDSLTQALAPFVTSRITLLNQSVLLKHINDDANALIALSEKLFAAGVMPYYLHTLDKVQGAAHFAVAHEKIEQLNLTLQQALPGYLVPRCVTEVAGARSKVPFRRAKDTQFIF